jgi:hypothetical protein
MARVTTAAPPPAPSLLGLPVPVVPELAVSAGGVVVVARCQLTIVVDA